MTDGGGEARGQPVRVGPSVSPEGPTLNVFYSHSIPKQPPLVHCCLHHKQLTVMKSRSDAEEAVDGARLKRWRSGASGGALQRPAAFCLETAASTFPTVLDSHFIWKDNLDFLDISSDILFRKPFFL